MPTLSGPAWVAQFPTSTSLSTLVTPFKANATSFVNALRAAGATVSIAATYRPLERAYLMHYSYKVANGTIQPDAVPAMAGVDIQWDHRNANGSLDLAASRSAAQQMVAGYQIVSAPALVSNHTRGLAIDMTISWTGTLTIGKADGTNAVITSTPTTGANTDLHAVGATYTVIKLLNDPPHWSADGN